MSVHNNNIITKCYDLPSRNGNSALLYRITIIFFHWAHWHVIVRFFFLLLLFEISSIGAVYANEASTIQKLLFSPFNVIDGLNVFIMMKAPLFFFSALYVRIVLIHHNSRQSGESRFIFIFLFLVIDQFFALLDPMKLIKEIIYPSTSLLFLFGT